MKGLLYKLTNGGIIANLLDLNGSFLHNRRQSVVLNGQSSNFKFGNAGAPLGSVLGPLFFVIYVKDLPQGLIFDLKLFVDDTSLFSIVISAKASAWVLNSEL